MASRLQDVLLRGLASARPAATAVANGTLYFATDTSLTTQSNGTAWSAYSGTGDGAGFVPPVDSAFAWVNQGTATVSATTSIFIEDATGGALNLRLRTKTAPATPYTLTTAWGSWLVNTSSSGFGLGWRDSVSGKAVIFAFRYSSTHGLTVDKYTTATAFSAAYTSVTGMASRDRLWLRIQDTGTNRICAYSFNGVNFIQVHTVARTDFLTADQVFFGLYVNTNAVRADLLSWAET